MYILLRPPQLRDGATPCQKDGHPMPNANLRLVEGPSVDKTKALDAALSQIERSFGKGSIMRLGKNQKAVEIETIPTGSLGLDIALGVGGLPRGRVVEIYGPESSGKTTMTLQVDCRGCRSAPAVPPRLSMRSTRSIRPMPEKLGVKVDDLLVSQPDTGEQALEIADMLVRSGAVDMVVVIDSVAALTPQARKSKARWATCHVGPARAPDEPGAAQAHRVNHQEIAARW